jgi:hypothetical protein
VPRDAYGSHLIEPEPKLINPAAEELCGGTKPLLTGGPGGIDLSGAAAAWVCSRSAPNFFPAKQRSQIKMN